jgi:hypothetical protein
MTNKVAIKEFTNDELLNERLNEKLKLWGVPDNFIIEEEAKPMVLAALSADDVLSVYIDKEQGLCINYSGDEIPPPEFTVVPNKSV